MEGSGAYGGQGAEAHTYGRSVKKVQLAQTPQGVIKKHL